MAIAAGTKPHPIFLAGRWVESPDPLVVANPADPTTPAGSTFHATEAQYEEAVEAALAAGQVTRTLPAYERGRILREVSAGIRARREELLKDPAEVERILKRGAEKARGYAAPLMDKVRQAVGLPRRS